MWVLIKIIEHGTGGDTRGEDEDDRVLPEILEEILVREHEEREEENEDEWGETEGDIGMEPEAEEESSEDEGSEFLRPESAKEKIERERQKKGGHDSAEPDAREVDRPVGSRGDKCRDESG